ncbi:MAG: alpha/beta hydrolase [Nitrososphaerota archaeon]|nr:alpha/beta hydrolase [Nitrososphaerota archaeon]
MLGSVTHGAPHDVVFVHGAGGNSLLWGRTLHFLSGDSTAVAVNLPGHPEGEITCKTVVEYAEALRSLIAESGLRSPAVCGHSMGGAVALTLAIRHPDALGGLILASTGARLGVDTKLIEGLSDNPMRAIENIITPWSFNSIDLGLGREARTALSVSNLPVFLNDYLACQGFDVRGDLASIAAKTLVVCGDKDRMTPPKWSHYLAANIPGSELYFVKDSGHMLPLEKPEALARVVQAFLAGL